MKNTFAKNIIISMLFLFGAVGYAEAQISKAQNTAITYNKVKIDGLEIGRGEANAAGSSLSWMTRWLEPGTHRVVIELGG